MHDWPKKMLRRCYVLADVIIFVYEVPCIFWHYINVDEVSWITLKKLLQSAMEFLQIATASRFITNCDGQLLQIATAFLLQSATRFITNCDRYYKARWFNITNCDSAVTALPIKCDSLALQTESREEWIFSSGINCMSVWEWLEWERKCSETVVGLDLMLVLSTARLCSLNLSFGRRYFSFVVFVLYVISASPF